MKNKISLTAIILTIVLINIVAHCQFKDDVLQTNIVNANDTLYMPKGDDIVYHKHYV